MKFSEAMQFIDSRSLGGMVLGLDSITELLKRLGNPQDDLKFIHIAGTNGKGSVGTYIASVLACAGKLTGRYVSPVILEYCERIQMLKGTECRYITKAAVAEKMEKIQKAVMGMERDGLALPTGFEIETAMAFLEFRDQKCEYVVLETGLGGIEDATNVIKNVELAVLTSISMDHMYILGDTIAEITEKKAGIIKGKTDVVCYDYRDCEGGGDIQNVIDETCYRQNSICLNADFSQLEYQSVNLERTVFTYKQKEYKTQLLGDNQPKNAALAIEAIQYLRGKGVAITDEVMQRGIEGAEWKGRFSVVSRKPMVIVDGAHNEDAAKSLAKTLKMYFGDRKLTFIVGIFADKEYEKILKITAPFANKVYAIETDNQRALPSDKLAEVAGKYIDKAIDAGTVKHALELAVQDEDAVIIAFGSLSFLGEVYSYFQP